MKSLWSIHAVVVATWVVGCSAQTRSTDVAHKQASDWPRVAFLGEVPHVNLVARPCPDTASRVYVDATGVVTLNNKVIHAEELSGALAALSPQPSEVCYSRASPPSTPSRVALAAMSEIFASHLPIAYYTDATFRTREMIELGDR